MPWYVLVPLVCVAVGGLAVLAGSLLPRTHRATSTIELRAAPHQVWLALTDWQHFPQWRRELHAVAGHTAADGRPGWIETSRFGRLPLVVERAEPERLLVTRIADDTLPFGGTWTHHLDALPDGGTRLASTEDGFVGPALFRLLARCVFGHHRTLNHLQRQLAGSFGEQVQPRNS